MSKTTSEAASMSECERLALAGHYALWVTDAAYEPQRSTLEPTLADVATSRRNKARRAAAIAALAAAGWEGPDGRFGPPTYHKIVGGRRLRASVEPCHDRGRYVAAINDVTGWAV